MPSMWESKTIIDRGRFDDDRYNADPDNRWTVAKTVFFRGHFEAAEPPPLSAGSGELPRACASIEDASCRFFTFSIEHR